MCEPRDTALDVALSSRDELQRAIDVAKQGVATRATTAKCGKLRDIMYGGIKPTQTVAIHLNMAKCDVECIWYSLSTVLLKDVYASMSIDEKGKLCICLSMDKLDLYMLSIAAVVGALQEVCTSVEVADDGTICAIGVPANIVHVPVRSTSLESHADDWECHDGEAVMTVFKGDKYMNVLPHCDVAFSTDASMNVSYMGKAKSVMLYRKYLSGKQLDLMVGVVLCSHPDVPAYDYSTLSCSDPIKRLTVRDLIKSMTTMALDNAVDTLSSPESSLIVRGTLPTMQPRHT